MCFLSLATLNDLQLWVADGGKMLEKFVAASEQRLRAASFWVSSKFLDGNSLPCPRSVLSVFWPWFSGRIMPRHKRWDWGSFRSSEWTVSERGSVQGFISGSAAEISLTVSEGMSCLLPVAIWVRVEASLCGFLCYVDEMSSSGHPLLDGSSWAAMSLLTEMWVNG